MQKVEEMPILSENVFEWSLWFEKMFLKRGYEVWGDSWLTITFYAAIALPQNESADDND